MKSALFCLIGVFVAATSLPGLAEAKKSAPSEGLALPTNASEFEQQVIALRKEMTPTGRFSQISAEERARVEENLDVITRLFEEKGELSAMGDSSRIKLINAQEEANAILTRNDDDRLICKMQRPTGSNFKQKQCMTVRQAREIREKARDGIERYRTPMQPALPTGGQ